MTFSIISCSSSVILTFVYQCLLAQACLCGPYVGPMSGRWDRHLSGVATQFFGVGGSAIFIDFLDSARGSTSQKRVESGGPDLGTPRAWSFALNAGALGVPSSGPLQQIRAPGGRFNFGGPRGGTPRVLQSRADWGGQGVGPLGPPTPALSHLGGPWGETPRVLQSRADWGGQGVDPLGPPTSAPIENN